MLGQYARSPNTTRPGGSFSPLMIEAVWSKGQAVAGYDPNTWRKDSCGAFMNRALYGSCTQYGWEIDHIRPVAAGGGDEIANLQPLQWQNNRHKGDDYPRWSCKVA